MISKVPQSLITGCHFGFRDQRLIQTAFFPVGCLTDAEFYGTGSSFHSCDIENMIDDE